MSFEDEMAEFDTQWETDKDRAPGGALLPDGKHQTIITESRIESNDNGWAWVTKFQGKGGAIRKWNNLDHEVGRSIAAQDAAMMGYEGSLSGLRTWVESEAPLGLVCDIGIKTKPGDGRDFTNVYLNRVLGKGDINDFGGDIDAVAAGVGPNPADDDDIPFMPNSGATGRFGI